MRYIDFDIRFDELQERFFPDPIIFERVRGVGKQISRVVFGPIHGLDFKFSSLVRIHIFVAPHTIRAITAVWNVFANTNAFSDLKFRFHPDRLNPPSIH